MFGPQYPERKGEQPHEAGHHHKMALASFHHAWEQGFGEGKRAGVVDFHHASVHVQGRLHRFGTLADAAAMHHDVDRAHLRFHARSHVWQTRRIGQIQRHHVNVTSSVTQRRRHFFECCLLPGGKDHGSSATRPRFRTGFSYATAGTGYPDDLVVPRVGHGN